MKETQNVEFSRRNFVWELQKIGIFFSDQWNCSAMHPFRPTESFLLLAIDEDLEVKNRILSVIFHIKKYSESHRLGSICHPGILSGDLNAFKIVVYGRD